MCMLCSIGCGVLYDKLSLRLLVKEVFRELAVDDGAVHADELPLLPRARVVVPAVVDELDAVLVAVPVVGLALVPVGEGEGAHLMDGALK